jgi:activating signal cointegrator 1
MRAISLWQPWASAIAIGVKKIETRSWPTSYRGPLAIHAAKTKEHLDYARMPEVAPAFMAAGIRTMGNFPLGAIVATCVLKDCFSTQIFNAIGELERALGNYDEGRFGWVLSDVVWIKNPIPFRGSQGFFNVPDELLAQIDAAALKPS